jgi:hypothetical protein
MTTIILIQLIAFYLVYWLADALHDSWFHKDKSYNALANRSSFTAEQRANYARLSLIFNRQWHAIDAAIKGMVIAVLAYALVGVSWWVLILFTLAMSLRWIWFDACWNWFMGLSFWYRGTVAATDGLKISDWLFFMLKFVLLAGSLTVAIILI